MARMNRVFSGKILAVGLSAFILSPVHAEIWSSDSGSLFANGRDALTWVTSGQILNSQIINSTSDQTSLELIGIDQKGVFKCSVTTRFGLSEPQTDYHCEHPPLKR